MRSLFFKIFLWFWLANTIVIGGLALVGWIYPRFPGRGPGMINRLHDLQVRGALAVRDAFGQEAFERHARELEAASGLRTYWYDENGAELLGQDPPAPESAPRARDGGPPRSMSFSLQDSQGARYTVRSEPTGGPGPPYMQELVTPEVFLPRLLTVVLAAGLGCYALARYLGAPMRRLQHTARSLAAGDLEARVPPRLASRRDEIGELGRDFDRMALQIQSLLTAQRRLLQDVSHELRSPLARLHVALELAGREAGPGAAPALARVALEAGRLNELIGQLLALTRLETRAEAPAAALLNLADLLTEVAADANFEAAASGRSVLVVTDEICWATGDRGLLRSAIENATRNALHFTPPGAAVRLSLRREPSAGALIEVRDHGPGVPEEELERIFQPFYRLSGARAARADGSGLGLSIARRAIEGHGGAVCARNAPGGGLLIEIRLPLADAPAG